MNIEQELQKHLNLDDWVRVDGSVWTFQRPAAHVKQQGLITAFVVPVVLGIVWVVLTALGSQDPNGVLLVGLLWAVLLGIPSAIAFLIGLRKFVRHEEISADSRRVLDVATATGKIRIRQPSALIKNLALERVEGGQVDTLLAKIPPTHAKSLKALGERVAAAMGTELIDTGVGSMDRFGMSDKTAGMLCWLPFQGIWAIASLWYLFSARDRPFVRSCAIQSLLWFPVTLVGCFLGAVLMAPAIALDMPVLAIPGGLVIGLFGIGNLVVRLIGCWKAYRGVPWVAPGLRPVMKRLMPTGREA